MSGGATTTTAPPRAEVRIDLAAYRQNLATLRAGLAGDAQLWAVVKANAYGHDVDRLAQEALAAGARRLCIATLSEARHLRQIGNIRAPLLIMGPLDQSGMRRAAELDASFAVLRPGAVDALEELSRSGAFSGGKRARVHLKVDTGMGRWGVRPEDAVDLLERLLALEGVEVEGLMTHFATADDPQDMFFETQLQRFEQVVHVARELAPSILVHAANSAATLRDPRSHFDAVRPGVATFGLDPRQTDPADAGLVPVLSMRSYVADVKALAAGESTGYSRTFVATEPCHVALVPVGYADGVHRGLRGDGALVVGGVRRQIVGNVSMDHVSLLVDEDVRVGDVVTVIGRDGDAAVTAEDHARWLGTINYEVTCGIAGEPRLLRVSTSASAGA